MSEAAMDDELARRRAANVRAVLKYQATAKGKATKARSRAKYWASEKGRAARLRGRARWNASERGKLSRERYAETEKGRIAMRRALKNYKDNPENAAKVKAREAVNHAVAQGKLARGTCRDAALSKCQGRIEADHYLGYEPDHWLDVEWRCSKHHHAVERSRARAA